jgi:hypothetical protein
MLSSFAARHAQIKKCISETLLQQTKQSESHCVSHVTAWVWIKQINNMYFWISTSALCVSHYSSFIFDSQWLFRLNEITHNPMNYTNYDGDAFHKNNILRAGQRRIVWDYATGWTRFWIAIVYDWMPGKKNRIPNTGPNSSLNAFPSKQSTRL